jgi:transcriptional regulator with XRE-family HTH domain
MTIRRKFLKRRKALSVQIGRRCRARRKELGWTQRNLANLTGLSEQTVRQCEGGHILVSLETLYRLADALQISLASLVAEDGDD